MVVNIHCVPNVEHERRYFLPLWFKNTPADSLSFFPLQDGAKLQPSWMCVKFTDLFNRIKWDGSYTLYLLRYSFWATLSWVINSWGSQFPRCENTYTTLWRDPCAGELRSSTGLPVGATLNVEPQCSLQKDHSPSWCLSVIPKSTLSQNCPVLEFMTWGNCVKIISSVVLSH
jgi:hypothetical protein